ncbi:MAG: hypothetical protein NT075_11875 [Chloroflexi bacterium]|nr:hypothetical protein [Chloroflexota bacterium]
MARKFRTPNGGPDFDPDAGGNLDDEAFFDIDNLSNNDVRGIHSPDFNVPDVDNEGSTPSLPIILLSAASGVSAGIIALYITYYLLGLPLEWSVALAILVLSAALGSTGALLSSLTGSRAATSNIAFSCGLIVVTLLFFALCTFVGAMAATFILTL